MARCSAETNWNVLVHILVSDLCKKKLIFSMTSPQCGKNVKLKKLHSKSPRFSAFFQRLCFYGHLEAFSGKVFRFFCKKHVFQPQIGPRGLSGSLQKLACPQFFEFLTASNIKKLSDCILETWDLHQKNPVKYEKQDICATLRV